jgi:hypothetical protein
MSQEPPYQLCIRMAREMKFSARWTLSRADLSMDGVEWSEGQLHSTPVDLGWSGLQYWSPLESSRRGNPA